LSKRCYFARGDRVIAALVPGDRELNEIRFAKVIGHTEFRPLDERRFSLQPAVRSASRARSAWVQVEIIADTLLEQVRRHDRRREQEGHAPRGVKHGKDFKPGQSPRSRPPKPATCASSVGMVRSSSNAASRSATSSSSTPSTAPP
jgi:hypothetical protein